jgi:GTP-binding protein
VSFIDEVVLHVRGGRGGDGCVAFRREKYVPRGGPSGGDGGHGGAVYLVGDQQLNTLFHLRFASIYEADRGRHGEGSGRSGKRGESLDVPVALGTQVTLLSDATERPPDAEPAPAPGTVLGEVLKHGERLQVAAGGRGGWGNARFATATHQAPRFAIPGRGGEDRTLRLELKLLADVGVVGLPNAGKSTLISVVSAARPKIADYPFTTLVPQLGVVARPGDLDAKPFVIADLPGLIAGAAAGAGLGHQFLRHVERCRLLVHLVDLSAAADVERDLEVVERELAAFRADLRDRERVIVGSKLDVASAAAPARLAAAARKRGLAYFEISAATQTGVKALVDHLFARLQASP